MNIIKNTTSEDKFFLIVPIGVRTDSKSQQEKGFDKVINDHIQSSEYFYNQNNTPHSIIYPFSLVNGKQKKYWNEDWRGHFDVSNNLIVSEISSALMKYLPKTTKRDILISLSGQAGGAKGQGYIGAINNKNQAKLLKNIFRDLDNKHILQSGDTFCIQYESCNSIKLIEQEADFLKECQSLMSEYKKRDINIIFEFTPSYTMTVPVSPNMKEINKLADYDPYYDSGIIARTTLDENGIHSDIFRIKNIESGERELCAKISTKMDVDEHINNLEKKMNEVSLQKIEKHEEPKILIPQHISNIDHDGEYLPANNENIEFILNILSLPSSPRSSSNISPRTPRSSMNTQESGLLFPPVSEGVERDDGYFYL